MRIHLIRHVLCIVCDVLRVVCLCVVCCVCVFAGSVVSSVCASCGPAGLCCVGEPCGDDVVCCACLWCVIVVAIGRSDSVVSRVFCASFVCVVCAGYRVCGI